MLIKLENDAHENPAPEISKEIPNKPRPAFETVDDPYHRKLPLYKVGEEGTPDVKVNIDLKAKDIQALWAARERYLWFSLIICCTYFVLVLAAY